MIKYLVSILTILVLFGCSNQNSNNEDFKNKIRSHIHSIEKYNSDASYLNTDSLIYTLRYLSYITGHQSQMDIGDVNAYLDEDKFNEDIKTWKKWIKKNKNNYTIKEADSIYRIKLAEK